VLCVVLGYLIGYLIAHVFLGYLASY